MDAGLSKSHLPVNSTDSTGILIAMIDDTPQPRTAGKLEILSIVFIFLVFAALYVWNAWTVPFGSGYDEIGHAAYIRNIAFAHAIPAPLSGWTTFHPPLYYLLSAITWNILERFSPAVVIAGIRMISSLAIILAGVVTFRLLRQLTYSNSVVLTSVALLLSLPASVMAASWLGNEAFTALTSSIACAAAVWTSRKQGDARLAFAAGIFSGLAFASKYTGLVALTGVLAAQYDLSARRLHLRNCILALAGFALLAGPVLFRNIQATGTVLPMTRSLAPIQKTEAVTQVDRSVRDYLLFSIKCLTEPRIYDYEHKMYNRHMNNVWGLTYAGLWFDPFRARLPAHANFGLLNLLPWLGLFPTLIMLFGQFDAAKDFFTSRLSQEWLPLLATAFFGLLMYVYWTWHAATLVAVKGSYLLPLMVPAACFFARGLQKTSGRIRWPLIVLCITAVLTSGVVLIQGLFYSTPFNVNTVLAIWNNVASQMPDSGIRETIEWWVTGR